MRRLLVLLTVFWFLCGFVCAAQSKPIKLVYKFTKVELDKYRADISINMTMPSMPGFGNPAPINIKMQTILYQRTLEVLPDGSAKVRLTQSISDLKIAGGPKGKMPNIAKQGLSMILTITPQGKVALMEDAEKLRKMLESMGIQGFDPSILTNQMGQYYVLLPEEPVEVGSTWKQVIPLPMGWGEMTVESTLNSYGEQVWSQTAARITQSFTGRMDLAEVMKSLIAAAPMSEKERQAMAGFSGSMDINGKMTFLFAPALGKILKGSGQMWATITINMPSEAVRQGAPSEMTMVMEMNISLTRFK
ncbi:MAG: hypothetical protein ACUVRS_11350 [Armatimonadota bacterium]